MRHGRWLRLVKFALLTLMLLLSRKSRAADGKAFDLNEHTSVLFAAHQLLAAAPDALLAGVVPADDQRAAADAPPGKQKRPTR